jgi:hypothetical protein
MEDELIADRRSSPRIVPERPLHARVEGIDSDFTVLDVSYGGLRLEGATEFRLAATYHFRIAAPDGRIIELVAKAVSCRRSTKTPETYETGFAFIHLRHPAGRPGVQALLDALTPVRVN